MAEVLKFWGYETEVRYCGVSALAAVRDCQPAVIILDIGLSPMNGFEFALRFRESFDPVLTAMIAVSGHTSQEYKARCHKLGINHYLYKPANLNHLQESLGLFILEPLPVSIPIGQQLRIEQPPMNWRASDDLIGNDSNGLSIKCDACRYREHSHAGTVDLTGSTRKGRATFRASRGARRLIWKRSPVEGECSTLS
ncbi:response regulator [Telmatocola sphagniphila]|uniref:Response regulator n=2 Tax=Telmatocola sphagniphila TaxID=1123043 RepID=A0A8E6B142_9BACT|nr:response regulator [Telmatocola sphagniphila]